MHSSRMPTVRNSSRLGGVPGPGGVYLVQGVPGPREVYLLLGGLPGLGGYLVGGGTCPGTPPWTDTRV